MTTGEGVGGREGIVCGGAGRASSQERRGADRAASVRQAEDRRHGCFGFCNDSMNHFTSLTSIRYIRCARAIHGGKDTEDT